MIRISFLAIVKNEEKYISEMLSSILAFDNVFFDYEIIIIDDHSDDETTNIISTFQESNENIKCFRNLENGKVAATFYGIQQCNCEWIKFIDGDDYLDLQYLEPKFFEGDVIVHDFWVIREEKLRLQHSKITNPLKFFGKGRSLPKGMFFCKKEILISQFPPPPDMLFEDFWINYVCLTHGKITYLDKPLYFYRQHTNNYYGNNDGFTYEKMTRMGDRYLDVVPKIAVRYGFVFDKNLIIFARALKKPSLSSVSKLILSPYYFAKLIYYVIKAAVR
jgi:glycosyltransferase involved in cell wall biosynthesis